MVEVDGRNLIFILSAPRSGSTLLAAMLGNHSAILAPPEPWILLPLSLFGGSDAQVIAAYDHELARQAVQGVADATLVAAASAAFSRTIYNRRLEAAGKSVFVDKTPRYFHILPWIGTLFPWAMKIWLQRNPLDVIASCKSAWKMTIDELLGDSISPNSFDATLAFDRLASFFAAAPAGALIVRYEELAADPASNLERVCQAAGIQFEPRMLDYGTDQALLESYATSPFGDRSLLAHRKTHTASIGSWRTGLTPAEVGRVLATLGSDIFASSGYADALNEAASLAGVDVHTIERRGRLDHLAQQCSDYALRSLPSSRGAQRTVVTQMYTDLQRHVGEREREYSDLQHQLEASEQQYTDLQRQLTARAQECRDLGTQVADLGAQVADLRQQLGTVTGERATATARVAALEQRLADQQAVLDERLCELTEQARHLSEYEAAWQALLRTTAYRLMRFLRLLDAPDPVVSPPADAGVQSYRRTAQREPPSK